MYSNRRLPPVSTIKSTKLSRRPLVVILIVVLCWMIFSENIRQSEADLFKYKKIKKLLPLLALMPKKKTILLPLPLPFPLPLPMLQLSKSKELPDFRELLSKLMMAGSKGGGGGGWGGDNSGGSGSTSGWGGMMGDGGGMMMMPDTQMHEMEGQSMGGWA